jgi:hypothetical protein
VCNLAPDDVIPAGWEEAPSFVETDVEQRRHEFIYEA